MSNYIPWTTEQKKQFAKRFSARDRAMYRKGQKNQYYKDYFQSKNSSGANFKQRSYTKKDFDALFDTLGEVKI